MKSKVSFLCAGALIAGLANSTSAMDFSDNVYGKANVSIGYNYRSIAGDFRKVIGMPYEADYDGDDVADFIGVMKGHKSSHGLTLGLGYNVYFKANDWFHPFVGLEATGQFDIKNRRYLYGKESYETVAKYWEFLRFNGKFGGKFIINNDFSVLPYATVGFNIVKTSSYVIDCTSPEYCPYWYKYLVGLTTGAGVDVLIKDRFSIGVEYRYVKVQKTFTSTLVAGPEKHVWENHNISVKFGYHFL